MKRTRIGLNMLAPMAIVFATVWCNCCRAHNGGILVQASGGKLVTGFDNESTGSQTIGDRAFSLLFPSSLANDIPSFLSLANAPAGSEPLSAGGQLFWDFLPMTHEGFTSNLLYWDGVGTTTEDVEFGAVPGGDTTLTLYTQNFAESAYVDGSATLTPGKQIGTISSNNLALHAHRWFFLDSTTAPPEGIYLFAMQLRMEGYENTDPFYIAAATDTISAQTLDNVALPWVQSHIDSLILEGDFNLEGNVDGADFFFWQRGLSPHPLSASDLNRWQANFGAPLAAHAVFSNNVPEPSTCVVLLTTTVLLAMRGRFSTRLTSRRRRAVPTRRVRLGLRMRDLL